MVPKRPQLMLLMARFGATVLAKTVRKEDSEDSIQCDGACPVPSGGETVVSNRSTSIRCPGSPLEEGELFPVLPVVRLWPQVLVWSVPDEEGQHQLRQHLAQ
mmetsp:Transcript_69824/g.153996  ORF Transcript_69824/g.153996 Transcript_69824/m.153996 type:complete len:102 (-) Transcript_69824:373-678(-)